MTPDLLSLNALRAFEAAARGGSFVAAAAELGVTAAAVSQQVRALESRMGRQLFQRQGNRILLTDAGREIYPALEQAFRDIASVAQHTDRPRQRQTLILSVLPWLAPWAIAALEGHSAPLDLRTEADPVALTLGAADLRLTYGAQLYPDHKVVPLFHDQMVIVGTLPTLPAPDRLIHVHWGAAYASIPGWALWHSQNGLPGPDLSLGFAVTDPRLALDLAARGRGVALVPKLLASSAPSLAQTGTDFTLSWPYALICLNARARNRPLAALLNHLSVRAAL